MNLLHLPTNIQEEILFLPRVPEGHDPIAERNLRAIVSEADWDRQAKFCHRLRPE